MARTNSTNNTTNKALAVTTPVYLLELGYPTPLRLSSRQGITFDGNVFTAVSNMVVTLGERATARFFNQGFTYGATILAGGTVGVTAKVWLYYGTSTTPGASDPDLYHDGFLGPWEITKKFVDLTMVHNEMSSAPKELVTDRIFHHLPADGTEFTTNAGAFVLRRG